MISSGDSQLRRFTKLGASGDIGISVDVRSNNNTDNLALKDVSASDKDILYKNIHIKREGREVFINGEAVSFTAHEFDIMCLIFSNPSKVYSRELLYQNVWKNGYYGEDNTVNVHVSNIRKKIAEHDDGEYIKTVWGIGFKAC